MNGRKARERRRQEQERTGPEASSPAPGPTSHPLGSWAGTLLEYRARREEAMELIAEANRKALLKCTGDSDCEASMHQPFCWAGR